ncbi:MAG: hypothetical protein Q8M76_00265, partial [Spirochaetaceae bacterium]|nr:hypothetical protein [Spirochaetaceae bacterium]
MALFVLDLTLRQREQLFAHQEREATTMAQSLSTSAAVWIVSDDIAGLNELVQAQRHYPELVFAILTDESGYILAHSDESKIGKYLLDLPRKADLTVIGQTPIIDIAVPSILGGKLVGWARVGIGQGSSRSESGALALRGAAFALAAMAIGSSIAFFLGIRLT